MQFKLDKNTGVPLYTQIKEQLKEMIENGALYKGKQLPTERELAQTIGVSRNTVSMAFRELEQEQFLIVKQGRGTFVAGDRGQKIEQPGLGENRKEKAVRFIDLAIDECLDLGFGLDQFMALTSVRVREREETLQKARVIFVDCNQEQLQNFVRQFREVVRIEIIPVLLSVFMTETTKIGGLLQRVDLIITTATHFDEVSQIVEANGMTTEVIPVVAQPKTENLIRLIRLAGKVKIGLICLSREFPGIVERALAKVGFYELKLDFTTSTDRAQLEDFIDRYDLLLAFTGRYKEVKSLAGAKEVIPYLHELDAGSVNLVRRALERVIRLKERKNQV
jgi:GntR family transcriptional regulator